MDVLDKILHNKLYFALFVLLYYYLTIIFTKYI